MFAQACQDYVLVTYHPNMVGFMMQRLTDEIPAPTERLPRFEKAFLVVLVRKHPSHRSTKVLCVPNVHGTC